MEIERKFLIHTIPSDIDLTDHAEYEQGYLSTAPVVRVRREGEAYVLTYKSSGMMIREEYNMPLTREAYEHLLTKVDDSVIRKTRYRIPLDDKHVIEMDRFHGDLAPLVMAEVEFTDEEDARAFVPPSWFGEEVTYDRRFHNSTMTRLTYKDLII